MTAATEYARALFELSEELSTTECVMRDFTSLAALIRDNPSYTKLLDTPAVPKEERIALINEALGSFDTHLLNLTKILAEHHKTHLLPKIFDEYSSLYDSANGIVRAEVISAVPLSEEQLLRLTNKLSERCKSTVKLTAKVEPELLGGLKLRYLGIQLDGTVKSRLEAAEKRLKDLVI